MMSVKIVHQVPGVHLVPKGDEGKQGHKDDIGSPGPRGDTGDRGPRGEIGMGVYASHN